MFFYRQEAGGGYWGAGFLFWEGPVGSSWSVSLPPFLYKSLFLCSCQWSAPNHFLRFDTAQFGLIFAQINS